MQLCAPCIVTRAATNLPGSMLHLVPGEVAEQVELETEPRLVMLVSVGFRHDGSQCQQRVHPQHMPYAAQHGVLTHCDGHTLRPKVTFSRICASHHMPSGPSLGDWVTAPVARCRLHMAAELPPESPHESPNTQQSSWHLHLRTAPVLLTHGEASSSLQ
jgi:hypothetical protein